MKTIEIEDLVDEKFPYLDGKLRIDIIDLITIVRKLTIEECEDVLKDYSFGVEDLFDDNMNVDTLTM